MASSPENTSMALFCDFENVALGVRDAQHDKFDIKRVLERLLLKGSIVVKKAYCDWDRYKQFKGTMHEANFELIEIPHIRQSGKNSADIRLVVDALDLCYTKSHVNTFVIISGDSDFSPLVSKLRENAKQVIGVGVKQSTSDLLIANCDEFIFYDDLVREGQRAAARRAAQDQPAARRPTEGDARRKEDPEARRLKAIELAIETLEALGHERGDGGKIRTSVLKDAIKRRKPDFNESYFGFRSFGGLLEEAQARGLLEIVRDEKANAYVQRAAQTPTRHEGRTPEQAPISAAGQAPMPPMAQLPVLPEPNALAVPASPAMAITPLPHSEAPDEPIEPTKAPSSTRSTRAASSRGRPRAERHTGTPQRTQHPTPQQAPQPSHDTPPTTAEASSFKADHPPMVAATMAYPDEDHPTALQPATPTPIDLPSAEHPSEATAAPRRAASRTSRTSSGGRRRSPRKPSAEGSSS